MLVLKSISDVKKEIKKYKKQELKIGLVPTMGALHEGHESLIKAAVDRCDVVVVSIFVNPIQFGPGEDYARYPRTLDKDIKVCEKYGVDLIFAPQPSDMYDYDKQHMTLVVPPECLRAKLCGKSRTQHFDGVDTVVLKLFNITEADEAFFGLKDAQQCVIIKRMCDDLNVNIKLNFCPIIREDDGLAKSSRNTYLSEEGRKKALALSKALNSVKKLYEDGVVSIEEIKEKVMPELSKSADVEYFEFCSFKDLSPVMFLSNNTLVALAARVEGVRLIDNIVL